VTASSTPEPNAAVPVPQQPQPRAVRFDERQAKPAARSQQQQKPHAAATSAAARRSDLFYGD
jgi:hypothetical protein